MPDILDEITITVQQTRSGFLITTSGPRLSVCRKDRAGTEAEAAEAVGDIICDSFEGGDA